MQLRVAIVGCGKIADGHVEEIRKLGNAKLVAVCDSEPLMAEQIATRYGIQKHYDDFAEMLAEEALDVVHITTPPVSHVELAASAIASGCHVLVEKPPALDYQETKQLIQLAESSGKQLTVGYTYAYDPPAVALRRLVRDGAIGDPVHIESYYGYDLYGMFGKALLETDDHWIHKLPGKLVQNNLDHALNKVVDFMPDPEPSVHAVGYRRRERLLGDVRDDFVDELRAVIIGDKMSAYVTFSTHVKPVQHFLRLYGTKGVAHADYVSRTVTADRGVTLPSAIGRLTPPFSQSWQYYREGWKNVFKFAKSDFHYFAGLNRLITKFYASILGAGAPPIPYRDILRVAWLMDRVIEQTAMPRLSDSGNAK